MADPEFGGLVSGNARVWRLWSGAAWAEGPVWFQDRGCLLFSDIPNDRMLRFTPDPSGLMGRVDVFRQPAGYTNGHTRDREGRLVSCEHGGRRVVRTEHDGTITVLAERWNGGRLNSPNDVAVKGDGTVWFTDPPYGILSDFEGHKGDMEYGACHVFRFDPATGDLAVAADDFVKPNGICFSPDERTLYVADTGASHDPDGPRHIRRFEVGDDNRLSGGGVFATCDVGLFDGFRCDDRGRVWTSAGDGVHCYAPDGRLLGKVKVPEVVANVAFGGAKRNRLYVCATTSLYAVQLHVNGALRP
ncbi:MAG: SMP-30/gluconolactonase/LRE family protein [Geminicoccaceae bacterium]|nr:SMP-30/gluconolactonase/LRE family protein [Geminicoccaceae bacterium]